ncbi:hypothetical protein LCGC14_1129260 [marine sediment metagenome]|uniref:Uncharacterized protein n=1 Tax=marine sediment metagenome TaxID=412755 RepID=A0A0F9Q7E6_9ZZZZ
MKLKTLKDIEKDYVGNPSNYENVSKDVLKKEAIKWVKNRDKKRTMDNVMETGRLLFKDFLEFFNITEKDLQSKEDLK